MLTIHTIACGGGRTIEVDSIDHLAQQVYVEQSLPKQKAIGVFPQVTKQE
jgi:hypothetical protein